MVARAARSGSAALVGLAVLSLFAAAVALVAAAVALGVWLLVRHPFCVVLAAGTAAAVAGPGPLVAAGLWALIGAAAAVWRARRRAGFDRRVLSRWRRTFVYGWRWRRVMVACDLDRDDRRLGRLRRAVPRLGNVRSARWTDTVTLHPLEGQGTAAFAARAAGLAEGFRTLACSVRADAAGVVHLRFRRGDPLRAPLPALPIAERPDLDALPLGVREDGAPWTVRLGHGHLLITGGAGSGKGSVVWSLARALAVPVRDGEVELWGVDGSGGFGLAAGEDMFARVALDGPGEAVGLLEDAVAVLRQRAGRRRSPRPATGGGADADAVLVVVLDEVVRWGRAVHGDLRRRLASALELLLAHGRRAGIVVVATAPAAEPALAALFPQRVALGPGDPPGVGYARSGRSEPVRVRVAFVGDDEVAAMAALFPARARRRRVPEPLVSLGA
jgi:S-DNA-T family DNA segregation ATPase FtsK/SpoIIIE